MADNTRMKELTGDVKRILEMMENRNKEYAARFETLETTLEMTLKDKTRDPGSISLAMNNHPFKVRNVKIDFPRFDGSDVFLVFNEFSRVIIWYQGTTSLSK